MDCIKEVIANEVKELVYTDVTVPVMINCWCEKCLGFKLEIEPPITLEDVERLYVGDLCEKTKQR